MGHADHGTYRQQASRGQPDRRPEHPRPRRLPPARLRRGERPPLPRRLPAPRQLLHGARLDPPLRVQFLPPAARRPDPRPGDGAPDGPGDDRRHAGRLEQVRLQLVGGFPGQRELRAVRPRRDRPLHGRALPHHPPARQPRRLRHLRRRHRRLAPRLAPPRRLRRARDALGARQLRLLAPTVHL